MRAYTRNGEKTMKTQIREYLIEHKKITTKIADEHGWTRLSGCIYDFKRQGMKIKSEKNEFNQVIYTLLDESEPVAEVETTKEPEIKLAPEDMYIKTTMKDVILDHLKKHKTITSAIAMKKYRCLNLCNVINRLRDEGWKISRSTGRENNDFNVASNRNNAYTIYRLESKTRKKTVYKILRESLSIVEKLIPDYTLYHNKKETAFAEAERVVSCMASHCNLFYGCGIVSFVKEVEDNTISLIKKETKNRFFFKKYEKTIMARFTIKEIEVEIDE